MARLYEIAEQVRDLFDSAEAMCEDHESMPAGMAGQLDEACKDLDQKLAGCISVMTEMQSESDMLTGEIDRLTKRRRAVDNRCIWLKGYIQQALETVGEDHLTVAGKWTLRLQNTTPSVVITNGDMIPAKFEIVTKSISKSLIKLAMDAGEKVPGADLVAKKTLRIY